MPDQVTLEDILFDDGVVGRDIEWVEDEGPTIRGPIVAIEERGQEVYFKLGFAARQIPGVGSSWYHDSSTEIGFHKDYTLVVINEDDRVDLDAEHFARASIYPQGQNLKFSEIKGTAATGSLN